MADMNLFMTDEDERRAIAFALQNSCFLVPDLDYDSPKYEMITSVVEYDRYRSRTRHFFLLSDRFFRCPLELRTIQKNGKAVCYISQRRGGPSIQFLGGGLFENSGEKFVRPGDLSYYPSYWNTLESRNEKPSLELIETYKSLQEHIKKTSIRKKLGRSVFWLGEGRRELHWRELSS